MIDIGKETIKTSCSKCNSSIEVTLSQVAEQRTVRCSSCGQEIKLVDEGGKSKKAIQDTKAAMDRLNNAFKNFGK